MKIKKYAIFIILIITITIFSSLGTFAYSAYKTKDIINQTSLNVATPCFYIDKNKTTSNFHIVEENTDDNTGIVEGNIDVYIKSYYNQNDVNNTKGRAYIQFYSDGKYKVDNANFKFTTTEFTATSGNSTINDIPEAYNFKFNNGKSDWFTVIPSLKDGEDIKISVKVTCYIQDLSDYINNNNDLKENLYVKAYYEQVLPEK